MAKRGGKRQKVKHETLWFRYACRSGIVQSFIVHIIILLILSLLFTEIKKHTTIKVAMSFEPVEEISMEPVEIPQPHLEPESTEDSSMAYIDAVIEDGNPISIEYEDSPADTSHNMPEIFPAQMYTVMTEELVASSTPQGSSKQTSKGDGIDDGLKTKMEKRLRDYNAQTGDIQVSISWDDLNDIDLWVALDEKWPHKSRSVIGWSNKFDRGGFLDIDMNVLPINNQPVENIVWNRESAPHGRYTVYVHFYKRWDTRTTVPVLIRIQNGEEVIYKKSMVNVHRGWIKVHTFTREKSH